MLDMLMARIKEHLTMDGYNIHRLIKTLLVSPKILSWYVFICNNNFRVYICYF